MSDIVERLRASVTQCRAVDRSELLSEAAAEIARLRGDAEIALLRLTDAERSAIADAADRYAEVAPDSAETAATLRGLLERLK